MKRKTKNRLYVLIVIVLIVFAWLSRLDRFSYLNAGGLVRPLIYIFLYLCWGIALAMRLIHPLVRRYMCECAALMMFWFVIRTIKFISASPLVERYMWYLYYVPLLLIPFLACLVSDAIGVPEDRKPEGKIRAVFIPSVFLILLVLTNDIHQLVFRFTGPFSQWSDASYAHGPGYFVIVAWLVVMGIVLLVTMHSKCRRVETKQKILWPCIPPVLMLAYTACNALKIPFLYVIAGDMTAVMCLLYAATLELCIECGFIQSNSGYPEICSAGSIGLQIEDECGNLCFTSHTALRLDRKQRESAKCQPLQIENDTLVHSHSIPHGTVFWQQDTSRLHEAIEEIRENNRELEERNRIEQNIPETQEAIRVLETKNRMEDLIREKTAAAVSRIDELLDTYEQSTDEAQKRRLLIHTVIIGTYIKRYGNLLMMSLQNDSLPVKDLQLCISDSFNALRLLGITCEIREGQNMEIPVSRMLEIFEGYEKLIEEDTDGIISISAEFTAVLCLTVCRRSDDSHIEHRKEAVRKEGNVTVFRYDLRKEGNA